MATKRHKRHSEERWKLLPEHIIRCQGHNPNGKRCGFEAEPGSVVCHRHGAAAPQTRRRAAERVIMTADEAVEVIKSFISDPTVPAAIRLKAAQDIADRAGLGPRRSTSAVIRLLSNSVLELARPDAAEGRC
jgi:hypothetical protein